VIRYVRVSRTSQTVEQRIDALKAAGVTVVYGDEGISGSVRQRDGLDRRRAPPAPTAYASHEIGRFALSPATLVWLKQQIAQAEQSYEDVMKVALPDPKAMGDALKAAAVLDELSKPPPPAGPSENS
jgi:hypothetical protein